MKSFLLNVKFCVSLNNIDCPCSYMRRFPQLVHLFVRKILVEALKSSLSLTLMTPQIFLALLPPCQWRHPLTLTTIYWDYLGLSPVHPLHNHRLYLLKYQFYNDVIINTYASILIFIRTYRFLFSRDRVLRIAIC